MSSAYKANGKGVAGEHEFPAFTCRLDGRDTLTSVHAWQCPYCDHSLTYADGQEDVVELAIASHLTRRHGGQMRMQPGVRP